MKKRGQVTVFIILGILVLIIFGLLFYFKDSIFGKELNQEEAERFVSARVEPLKDVVRNCVKAKLMQGVRFVSWQGGYFNPVNYESIYTSCDENCLVDHASEEDVETTCCTDSIQISYSCHGGANTLPLLSFISKEINEFMSDGTERAELEECVQSAFDNYEKEGLELDYKFIDLVLDDPVVLQGRIRQNINFPVDISRSGYSSSFVDLGVNLDSNLYDVYMIAVDVVNAECNGEGFEVDDYVWEHAQGGDILAAFISNGLGNGDYKPWYLQSFEPEEDGESLRFHFMIEE